MKKITTTLTELFAIDFPIIMDGLFKVTSNKMVIEAMNIGAAACIPALNFLTTEALAKTILEIKAKTAKGSLGVHLMIGPVNVFYRQQLATCIALGVDFVITSVGDPTDVIEKCQGTNVKVLCQVLDEITAKTAESLGADAIIAVNNEASQPGKMSANNLISLLNPMINIPIISAGGVGNGQSFYIKLISEGYAGCVIGSVFIATQESNASPDYKKACVEYSAKDIVVNYSILNKPVMLINTPFLKRISAKPSSVKKILSRNKRIGNWLNKKNFFSGIKTIGIAANTVTYKTVWVASRTIQFTTKIKTVKEIIESLVVEYWREVNQKSAMSRSVSRKK